MDIIYKINEEIDSETGDRDTIYTPTTSDPEKSRHTTDLEPARHTPTTHTEAPVYEHVIDTLLIEWLICEISMMVLLKTILYCRSF